MSDSDAVTMNIPKSHPLFDWIAHQPMDAPIEYVRLTVGNISARLALEEVVEGSFYWDNEEDPPRYKSYLETSWRLLRDNT